MDGVDPARQFASSYLAHGNNPINLVDSDGERAIPVNEELKHYGYVSQDDILFPANSTFDNAVQAVQCVSNIFMSGDAIKALLNTGVTIYDIRKKYG